MDKQYRASRELLTDLERELARWQYFLDKEIPQMLVKALELGGPENNWEYEFVMEQKEACIDRIKQYEQMLSHAVIVNADGTEEPYHYAPESK